MAERLNAHDSKSCDAGMYPRVQIPLSAPQTRDRFLPIPCLLYTEFREGFEGGIIKNIHLHILSINEERKSNILSNLSA